MQADEGLLTRMLPILGRSIEPRFNVFDVMHHGLHEKQISNVFSWLLKADATHGLGDRFARIFIDEINGRRSWAPALSSTGYAVQQEINTSTGDDPPDIADIVLESDEAVIVVENYFTSDGHGHCYKRYHDYGERDGRTGVVVLLCGSEDASLQTAGWEQAPVLTYGRLVSRLWGEISADAAYARDHPDARAFIGQMHQKFVKGDWKMDSRDVLKFVVAMCDSGEVRRYQLQRQDLAAEEFASDLAEQARERFSEGRELLQQVKNRLKQFSSGPLATQLNATFGTDFVRGVTARYSGTYQWTINFDVRGLEAALDEARLQIKFGPSAWYANSQDHSWRSTVPTGQADYSRLFLTRSALGEIRQSAVSLQEVVDGLDPDDHRLHDEIARWLQETGLFGDGR